jgi:hypothetical protein
MEFKNMTICFKLAGGMQSKVVEEASKQLEDSCQ